MRKDSAERRPRRTHTECAYKQVIKRYISSTCRRYKVHGTFAVSHAAENGAYNIICRYKRYTDEADCKVIPRARRSVRGGRNGGNDCTAQDEQQKRQSHGKPHKQRYGIARKQRRPAVVPTAYCLPDIDRSAHGKPHYHNRQHMHDLRAYGNRGSVGNTAELTDYQKICHSVKGLQEKG